ncbi:hypothetical protein HPB50_024397 [Hyalomma asiaticum]|uniref:Uncharacterized protein n=1 Tax=Hyalomma asiaticum TaxID=266040 RepID=A0ACB7SCC3_HYAAI|nr:hypothetical protein HPB50_024397 [Hyalomma asiaticum]
MDSAPSQQRDTAELLAPIEARLSSLEVQMASIVTTIEDRLAAALQTVFNRIPSMIAAQSPQIAFTTRRAKLKRISNSKEHRPLSEVTKVDEQSGNSNATSDHLGRERPPPRVASIGVDAAWRRTQKRRAG